MCFQRSVWRALLVGIGGFVGSIARYWVSGLVQSVTGPTFPFGTLAVNVVGSFLLGVVLSLSLDRGLIAADLRLLLTVGVCGGFTTMSTFSYETVELMRDGQLLASVWNVTGTVVACCAAVWLGALAARVL
jgi:CrcB protein